MYQHAKPWAYDFSRFSDFQLRDALLKLFAAGELRIWQLTEGWGQPPEGNGIGEGGLVMTGSSAAPGTTYKKVLQPGGAADTESIGVVDAAIGVADLMATGLVNTGVDIVAGGAGLVTLAISGGDVDAAVYTMESVQENQVGPFTQAGEEVAKVVAPVVDKYYEQNMAAIGEKTLEVTDSPLLAMAAHKSVELVGTVMGAGVVGNAVKRAAKVDVDVPNKPYIPEGIDAVRFEKLVDEFAEFKSARGFTAWKQGLIDEGLTPVQIQEMIYQGSLKRGENLWKGDWKKYYEEISGTQYPGPPSHAHHLVEKGSSSPAAIENRKILEEVGINPLLSRDNLTWAPNITGQHGAIPQGELLDKLSSVRGDKDGIIDVLKQWAKISGSRT